MSLTFFILKFPLTISLNPFNIFFFFKFLKHYLEIMYLKVIIIWMIFVFNFEEALISFKFKNFDNILQFNYVDLLLVNLIKVVPLTILADGKCSYFAATIYISSTIQAWYLSLELSVNY